MMALASPTSTSVALKMVISTPLRVEASTSGWRTIPAGAKTSWNPYRLRLSICLSGQSNERRNRYVWFV